MFGEGMIISVIGFGMVFVCLVLLIALFSIMGKLLGGQSKPSSVAPVSAPVVPSVPVVADEQLSAEIVAVIAAAIAAVEQTENTQLIVRAIRRVPDNTPAWNRAGRNARGYN